MSFRLGRTIQSSDATSSSNGQWLPYRTHQCFLGMAIRLSRPKIQHGTIPRTMSARDTKCDYALGSTDAEHERLIRQAALLEPLTERFFRAAGIGPGQRVLDIGSGVGDVAMLAARLVGPSGEVVGVERDTRSIARARVRVAEAQLHNVSFLQSDVCELSGDKPFDAVVGRFILQFLPDPVAALRSLSQLVRPGGVLAFHEPSWKAILPIAAHVPLWSACAFVARESLHRSGGNTEMGITLGRTFTLAGLPSPNLQMEIALGDDASAARWIYDLLCTLLPRIRLLNLPLEGLGDLDTLPERLRSEVAESNSSVPCIALVGAWARRPEDLAFQ
jgi:2-polyprenyl-3-methyl-5-hydroxy-6-metoxy-1,4-benzoquinol methylase